ncbi:hypothetical protein ACFQFC_04940 [Amorphoplanes digitatis]|uniref:DUF3558 domain-containing protein n=1 Tax=Actinoplanes digitatis TaxID=1868 RepID=A0A7W7MRE3_9ACTN|nr:hypothetical protein [Actinoplanes digitatis]MBB4763535.1 hypothetical protein [Actinoplanes digitatis]GID93208.1 hypothetical protein Adi01nite_26200 [Actinoplanes digitatis]
MTFHKVGACGALLSATLALPGCALLDDPVKEPVAAGAAKDAAAKDAPAMKLDDVDACKLLTAAELKETFGGAADKPAGGSTTIDNPVRMTNSNCIFGAKDDAVPFKVYVIVQQYETKQSGDNIGSTGSKPVSGVGEAAVSVEADNLGTVGPPTTQVRFVIDNKLVNVSRLYDKAPADPAGDVAVVVELAKKVASRL